MALERIRIRFSWYGRQGVTQQVRTQVHATGTRITLAHHAHHARFFNLLYLFFFWDIVGVR